MRTALPHLLRRAVEPASRSIHMVQEMDRMAHAFPRTGAAAAVVVQVKLVQMQSRQAARAAMVELHQSLEPTPHMPAAVAAVADLR